MSTLSVPVTTMTHLDGIYVRTNEDELYFIAAQYDDDPINPHDDYGTIELVTTNNRYFCGDITCSNPCDELEARRSLGQEFVAMPLYLYAHSGVSISIAPYGDPWDSGQVGYAVCSKENAIAMLGTEEDWRENAANIIRSEVSDYDTYLTGPNYVYELYQYDTNSDSWDMTENVSGFHSDNENEMFSAFFSSENAVIISEEEIEG